MLVSGLLKIDIPEALRTTIQQLKCITIAVDVIVQRPTQVGFLQRCRARKWRHNSSVDSNVLKTLASYVGIRTPEEGWVTPTSAWLADGPLLDLFLTPPSTCDFQ